MRRVLSNQNHESSRYKGVRMRKWGKFVAEIRQPNSRDRIWLGSYDTPEEAGRAYAAAVFCLRGPFAVFNFPSDPPQIELTGREFSKSEIQDAAARHARRDPSPPAEVQAVEEEEERDGSDEGGAAAGCDLIGRSFDSEVDWSRFLQLNCL